MHLLICGASRKLHSMVPRYKTILRLHDMLLIDSTPFWRWNIARSKQLAMRLFATSSNSWRKLKVHWTVEQRPQDSRIWPQPTCAYVRDSERASSPDSCWKRAQGSSVSGRIWDGHLQSMWRGTVNVLNQSHPSVWPSHWERSLFKWAHSLWFDWQL